MGGDDRAVGGDAELERALAVELVAGERVVWTGRPVPAIRMNRVELIAIPATVAYALAATFFALGAVHNLTDPPVVDGVPKQVDAADVVFWVVMGGFFVVTALYGLVGRFVWAAHDCRRTRYVMTERRVLDVEVDGRRRVGSLPLERVVGTRSEVRADGHGTVAFGDSSRGTPGRSVLSEVTGMQLGPQANAGAAIVFRDVDDADDLLALLRARDVGV